MNGFNFKTDHNAIAKLIVNAQLSPKTARHAGSVEMLSIAAQPYEAVADEPARRAASRQTAKF